MSRITDKNAGAKQQRNGQWSPRLSATAHPKRPVVGHLRFATRAKAISEAEVLSRKIIDGDLTLSELLGAKAPTPVQVTMAPTVDDIIRAFISERANNQTIKPTQHRSWRSLRKSRISASGGIGQLDATTITVPQEAGVQPHSVGVRARRADRNLADEPVEGFGHARDAGDPLTRLHGPDLGDGGSAGEGHD